MIHLLAHAHARAHARAQEIKKHLNDSPYAKNTYLKSHGKTVMKYPYTSFSLCMCFVARASACVAGPKPALYWITLFSYQRTPA